MPQSGSLSKVLRKAAGVLVIKPRGSSGRVIRGKIGEGEISTNAFQRRREKDAFITTFLV